MVDRASLRIAGGIAVVIIVLLASMILLARTQMPVEVTATTPGDSDTQAATADADSTEEMIDENAADEGESAAEETSEEESGEEAATADSSEADSEEVSTEEVSAEDPSAEDVAADSDNLAEQAAEPTDETADNAQTIASVSLSHAELTGAFAAGGCTSCHLIPNITGAIGQLGPDLSIIGSVAATRVEGQSAEEYLRASLHDPDAFVVADCPTGPCTAGIMQAANLNALTDDEVEGMIQYMLALTNETGNTGAAEVETEAADSTDEEVTEDSATGKAATEAAAEDTTEEEPIDIDAVAAIVTKGTCGACHVIPGIDGAAGMVGPDLSNIGTAAATRIDGYSAGEYLLESILDPNAFIAPECPAGDCLPGLMLPNLADLLTTEEIDTLVGYLVTLDGE